VTHLAAAVFFTFALLAAAVVIHMQVRRHWSEILFALKGEWHGVPHYRIAPVRRPVRSAARASAPLHRRAAA
jgi:hypothetical protein